MSRDCAWKSCMVAIVPLSLVLKYHGDTVIVWEQVKRALSTVSILWHLIGSLFFYKNYFLHVWNLTGLAWEIWV